MKLINFCMILYFGIAVYCKRDAWKGLDLSMVQCLRAIAHHIASLEKIYSCFRQSLYRCHNYHTSYSEYHLDFQLLCGVLNTGWNLRPFVWVIRVYKNFGIFLDFLDFHLPCSVECQKASVIVSSEKPLIYCGKRVPWDISVQGNMINVVYFSPFKIYQGFYFIMVYEAIDITSPDVTRHGHSFWSTGKQTVQYSLFGNRYAQFQYNMQNYHLIAGMLSKVCITVYHLKAYELEIYDGPGTLSSLITITDNTNSFICLSAYYGFVRYFLPDFSNETMNGKFNIINNLELQRKYFTWEARPTVFSSNHCRRTGSDKSSHMSSSQESGVQHCVWKFDVTDKLFLFDEIHINKITFEGMNHLSGSISEDICQYGGLHIRYMGKYRNYGKIISVCESNDYKVLLNVPHLYDVAQLFFIFTTYTPYTNGLVEVTYQMSSCSGYLYEIYDFQTDDFKNIYYVANNKWQKIHFDPFSKNQIFIFENIFQSTILHFPTCTEIWIQYHIEDIREMDPNEVKVIHRSLQLNDLFQTFFQGSQKSIISHWVLPLVPYPGNPNTDDYYNFEVNATTIENFPTDLSKEKRNLIVHNGETVNSFLPHLMPPLHRDMSELGVVPCGKESWTRPHGTTWGGNMPHGDP